MVAIKSRVLFLLACFLEVSFLLLAQVTGNVYILFPCLLMFLVSAVWVSVKKMAVPFLFFFLPFAPIMKIQPGTISFYTIALLCVYLIYTVLGSRNINVYHLIPGLLLFALTLTVKTLYGNSIDRSFILFIVSILLVPFLARELNDRYDFYWLTLFLSAGIVLAAISSQYLYVFPTISRYIETINLFNVTRLSGYYGDPNFYATHITAALSGVLVMLLNSTKKSEIMTLILTAMLLLYCGFLSVSKSFLLVTVFMILFWVLEFFFKKGKMSVKLLIILTVCLGIIFLLSFTIFTDLIDMMISRLSRDKTLSDFTTRRIELWAQYMNAFDNDFLLLLFGKGITKVLVNDRAAHNTVIQMVYQVGLVGSVGMISWFICYVRTLLGGIKIWWGNFMQILILAIGIFGPWMALDMMHFDEFFLLPIYACVGLCYLSKSITSNDGPTIH